MDYVIFTKRKVYRDPVLFLCGSPIDRKLHTRYLGIIFDSKLTWKIHIDDIVEKCEKPLNIMKAVARRQWGSDRKSLQLLYTSLIRPKMDYGSFLFETAAKSNLIKLDRVQYEAIRIIAGLLKSIQ